MVFNNRLLTATRHLRTPRSVAYFALGLLAIGVATGCSEARPERVPISGVVLIDGQPMPDCYIQFVPSNGRASRGHTDSEGRFSLTCYEDQDGVLLGAQRVSVTAFKEINGETIQWNLPKKYMDHKTSNIRFEIDEPNDNLKIELTWDGDKPFVERNGVRVKNYRGGGQEVTE